ncbi:hypothetical protein [Pseudoxanthomonas dokdonensis]|uniref:H-type lectin domain-containing protein n=1 Tax=Pseudoxanthomonas dokdonensis TaxID=344882 RepID=A0A0R0CLV5_9GAMM|nr:hypothetical protein [Pseudoxanthomonas dokdonensis]KRG70390.1 hypothetical protein ABB29_06435 [Pseudoxanthomonas dokdonensis]
MLIRNSNITFNRFEGSGPRQTSTDVDFGAPLSTAAAILTGFNASFSSNDGDHHLGNLDVRLDADVIGNGVRVTATFGLRDWSGNWDDKYEGQIFFAVVGE